MSNPEVIVTGFPHSGTSFITEVVHTMGLAVGSSKNLKGSNAMNRRGHFEHLPIRNIAWKHLSGKLNPCNAELYDAVHTDPDPEAIQKIKEIAEQDNVQVYKDTFYPVLHKLFPDVRRVVAIDRTLKDIFDSPGKSKMAPHAKNIEALLEGHFYWWQIMDQIALHIPTLYLRYETFKNPKTFEFGIWSLAAFLGIDITREIADQCHQVYAPK